MLTNNFETPIPTEPEPIDSVPGLLLAVEKLSAAVDCNESTMFWYRGQADPIALSNRVFIEKQFFHPRVTRAEGCERNNT